MDQQPMMGNSPLSIGVPNFAFGQALGPGYGNVFTPGGSMAGGEGGGDSGGSNSGGAAMQPDLLSAMMMGQQGAVSDSYKYGDYFNPQSQMQRNGIGDRRTPTGGWGPSNYNGQIMPQEMVNNLNYFKSMTPMMANRFKTMSPLLSGFQTNFGQGATIGSPAK